MEFLNFLLLILVILYVWRLNRRIERIESAGRTALYQQPIVKQIPGAEPATEAIQAPSLPPGVPDYMKTAPITPSAVDRFIEWLKRDPLLKVGALLLLIAFGWFTTYAFLNNWIGPMGRIALGLIAGTLIIILGYWRIRTYLHQGSIFLVLGSTTILLTTFAAREVYNFFTPLSALGIMFLSCVFVAVASVKYRSRELAFSSLILAGAAPLLVNSPSHDPISLFAYLFVVVLGTIWIAALIESRELVLGALVMVILYSVPEMFGSQSDALLLFAYGFCALFFTTHSLGILNAKGATVRADVATALVNGLFLIAWIVNAVAKEWQSLIMSAWMLVFLVGSFLLFQKTRRREAFYAYAGVAGVLLAAATAAELNGATLVIAYTIEAALATLLSYVVTRDVSIAERTSWLMLGPTLLSFGSIVSSSWSRGVLHEDFFVLLILALSFFGLGLILSKGSDPSAPKSSPTTGDVLSVFGSVYAYVLLWLSLHAALRSDDLAVMISLIIYTAIGITSYVQGTSNGRAGLRGYGGALLAFVVGRLLLIDVWNMELTGRIITFFLIGGLLMSTAFLGKKKTINA